MDARCQAAVTRRSHGPAASSSRPLAASSAEGVEGRGAAEGWGEEEG